MKTILAALLVITTSSAWGQFFNQDEEQIINIWDGSFAYNRLIVNEHKHQDNIVTIYLSGATLGIGEQMAGTSKVWSASDLVRITLRKESCEINKVAQTIECDQPRRVTATITWDDTPVTTRTYHGVIENIKVSGQPSGASVSFDISENDHFEAAVERPSFEFKGFNLQPLKPVPSTDTN